MTGDDGWREAVEVARQRGGRWQLQVWHRDDCVLDEKSHPDGPDLFWLWSASKPFIALLAWQQVERGVLELDAPLTTYWPEFGQRGKQDVTLRHVLQHRSGLPTGPGGTLGDALVMSDWRWSIHRLEHSKLRWPPGERAAYHYLDYGFMLGEVLVRATGRDLPGLMRQHIFEPLRLHDSYLGLPDDQLHRAVPMDVRTPLGPLVAAVLNSRRTRQAVIPAGGVSSTAADLARFYRAMAAGGELDGVRVVSPEVVAQMRLPSTTEGERDGLLRYVMRWAQGFQLGGPGSSWPRVEPYGRLSSPESFGHNGSNMCVGWVDPASGLVVAFVSNTMRSWPRDLFNLREGGDALHRAAQRRVDSRNLTS